MKRLNWLPALFLILEAEAFAAPAEVGPMLSRSFVWLASAPTGQQTYAAFRKRIELTEAPQSATLHLFADSRYFLWINGQAIERGPCRFDPIAPEYDTLEVGPYLRRGANVLAILVHHYHDGTDRTDWVSLNGRIMRHAPGLTARLELAFANGSTASLSTDRSWRGTPRTRFQPAPLDRWENCWGSIPDRIDARLDHGDWTLPEFNDDAWETAQPVAGALWGPLRPRGIPLLRETVIEPLTVVALSPPPQADSGTPAAAPTAGTAPANEAFAGRRLAELLPLSLTNGHQLILDAGQFLQAYSTLDFAADDGSEFELEYAQNYFDTGRKPTGSYGRVNRYVARAGRQSYASLDTFGFKYLVLRVKAGRIQLHGLKLINRLYPFDRLGRFTSNDPVLDQIWRQSVHTIQVCAEDAYVDCATRERAAWMADGFAVAYRVTRVALGGPSEPGQPHYSDARLLRALLRHIGQSQQPDGRLKAHHPSDRWDIHGYIEDYACLWVHALREYTDHTGDLDLARELWPALTAQLQWFLDRRAESGLVRAREFVYFGNPLIYKVCEGATLNAFVYGALQDAATLSLRLGKPTQAGYYREAARQLQRAVQDRLWAANVGSYHGALLEGRKTEPTAHAALACLFYDLVPAAQRPAAFQWLMTHYRKEGLFPYTHYYLLREMARAKTDEADREALRLIRERWTPMTRYETGTVSEGFGPGENCHESAAAPAYYLSAYVLGVRLDGPVTQRRLLIEPHLGDLTNASGQVVTELGPVPIAWERSPDGRQLRFSFAIPAGCQARVCVPQLTPSSTLILEGHEPARPGAAAAPKVRRHDGRFEFEQGPGAHAGRVEVVE